MKKFWDMNAGERAVEVGKRMRGDKWIVWDYCPDKQGNYGVIEKCPHSVDHGFQHGYVFKDPKVCALHHSYVGIKDFEINVYTDDFPLNETFEHRSKNMWHMFSTFEQAEQYAAQAKRLFPEHLSLQELLPKVRELFPDARITTGKRGYESVPYECIVADNGWTTFDVSDGLIGVQFGQHETYIIPHSELLKPAFSDIQEGHINDRYCVDYSHWNAFYGDSLRNAHEQADKQTVQIGITESNVYKGTEAQLIYGEILESERTSRELIFPAHTGAQGIFEEGGKYVAFDNSSNDCWVENFWSEDIALRWVRGDMSAEDAHQLDNQLHQEKKNANNIEEFSEKVPNSQKNFVSLQQENNKTNDYDTDNYRRSEAVASEDDVNGRHERLGLRAFREKGRPTLGSRWDTELYEEGLQSSRGRDLLGGPESAIRTESDRLIAVAKQHDKFIPSVVWDSFGFRYKQKSSESVVFLDKKNSRVVKFKDPFIYTNFKHKNPYTALYEHHIHNNFFGNVPYCLLGISQDPNSGNARFAFEQPYVHTYEKPSIGEIRKWMESRGFEYKKGGYTDGYVSIIDAEGDNCIKDSNGMLNFIDPIIRFEKPVKEVLDHYIEINKALDSKLQRAGIGVGSRFKIDKLNSLNDFEVKRIDYGGQRLVFGPLESNTHPGYQGEFEWPVDRVLDNIKLSQGSRWIQIDENRNEIVIPAAKQAILERIKDPSPHAALTDCQVKALDRYCTLFSDNVSKEEAFIVLVRSMKEDFKKAGVYDEWVDDIQEELTDLAHGERHNDTQGLKR